MCLKAYDVWRILSATGLHFKVESYDAIRFNFKGKNLTPSAYEKSKTRYAAEKRAKLFQNETEARQYAFANYLYNDTTWLGSMSEEPYYAYLKYIQAFSYMFKLDLKKIEVSLDQYLSSVDGEYPPIIQEHVKNCKECTAERVLVFDCATNFMNIANKKVKDTLLWPEIYKRTKKCRQFFEKDIDVVKAKKVMVEHFSSLQA